MDTPILGRIEQALKDFQPRTQREFVLLQIARRFGDEDILAKYLNEGRDHPKKVLMEAARLAQARAAAGKPAPAIFFDLLRQIRAEEAPT
jgi:hypothetical protein